MVKAYDALPRVARILLQIFCGYFVSFFYRLFVFIEKKDSKALIGAIISAFTFVILWVIDLFTVITKDKITVLA